MVIAIEKPGDSKTFLESSRKKKNKAWTFVVYFWIVEIS
jgi:hypothetical protein